MPLLASLPSLLTRGFRAKRDFYSRHEGRPSRKHVGVEFDTPESHEYIVADVDVLCRRKQLSQNSGYSHGRKGCRTRLIGGIGKTRRNLSFFFVPADFPSLNRTICLDVPSSIGVPTLYLYFTRKRRDRWSHEPCPRCFARYSVIVPYPTINISINTSTRTYQV